MKKVKLGPQTLLYPTPAVLVGALVGGKPNYMTAAWCGIAASMPPAITVALQPVRYTLKGIREQGVFSINVPSAGMVKKVDHCGIYSGNKKDKSTMFKAFYGVLEKAPLIEECPVNLECKAIHFLQVGSHVLIIGEIVETYVNEGCVMHGKADPEKVDPLIYTTGTMQYHRLGEVVANAFRVGREG